MSTHQMKQWQVVGRKRPVSTEDQPEIYRMKVFAVNEVCAKSRFWYFLSQLRKMKKSTGEILSCGRITERNENSVRIYGIWVRYNSRSGTHNIYKEYRDTALDGAVNQMFEEMASRNRARRGSIQILRCAVVPGAEARRANTKQFIDKDISFTMPRKVFKTDKRFRKTFRADAPQTHF
mmetsp:Transcript_29238/g.65672  ORF Transcript_29238/g.65672 Transcript_29238/m.65672 type:complete len:178 (-) Transcript_29238:22-555(-)|eukprot:TRINITY_DN276_c1_g3_i1.p2 TRINITY_DN276_c1_g3~~TRINITY_DN276_c1_g3_i1.p2  ORF type:complete len:209 (+),score=128.98 TRINITY_DN276_c1_g3_i1:96-629(+)